MSKFCHAKGLLQRKSPIVTQKPLLQSKSSLETKKCTQQKAECMLHSGDDAVHIQFLPQLPLKKPYQAQKSIKKEPVLYQSTGSNMGLPYDFDTVKSNNNAPVSTAHLRLQTDAFGCILSKRLHMTRPIFTFILFIRIIGTIPFVKYFCFSARYLANKVAN